METLREKFKQNVNFVKPLYKKVRTDNKVKPYKKLFVNVTNDAKLCGDEIYVKREIVKTESDKVLNDNVSVFDRTLPSGHKWQNRKLSKSDFDVKLNLKKTYNVKSKRTMITGEDNGRSSKSIQADSHLVINKHRDYWLRVYPAAQIPGESLPSVILRCLICQLGLATFLVLWTIAWVFVINYFEGPFEAEVSVQFEKDQNQLVIDLATELRQITPISPKWRNAIERRIEDERELTLQAVARGAKLHPGPFWNLSGTFLFTIYVMTALGQFLDITPYKPYNDVKAVALERMIEGEFTLQAVARGAKLHPGPFCNLSGTFLFTIYVMTALGQLLDMIAYKAYNDVKAVPPERRIEDERELTLQAVARGAKLHPGPFWYVSGTFLFTIYVMTALGFGAPVPQTLWGRTSGIVYAALSVPTHIYLMVNFSTCVVANTEANLIKFKKYLRHKRLTITETSDHSAELTKRRKRRAFRKRLICLFNVLTIGRCVPLATITYYTVGAISFGLLRGRQPLEIVMFPLQFTTTGGLEHVQNYVRLLYGVYVEGAMILLACTLATLRRHNGAAVSVMSQKYRLFTKEK